MKKNLWMIPLAVCFLLCAAACAEEDPSLALRLAQTASGRSGEYVTELSDGWKFGGKDEDAFVTDYDDSTWETVSLPHTWNAADGADGGSNYQRTAYWYRNVLNMDTLPDGKRVYLEFLGANQQTDLYVNGTHMKLSGSELYAHGGGYTAFRFDMTDALRPGPNAIAVLVNNARSEKIAPYSGDFNMYGGLYRRVFVVTVDDVHVDLSNCGSSGLFLTTPNIRSKERPDDLGALNIRADIVNQGAEDRNVTVAAHIDGDNAPTEDIVRAFTVPAGGSVRFQEDAFIPDPHLWKGIDYSGKTDGADAGYRYTVTLTVSEGGRVIDSVSDKVGFRYFYVDKETGFYLNGESYPLRGVNRHQYKEGLGSALTEKDHEEDMSLIMELGANTVRLCHYPHTDYFYELCDQYGIVVWTEIPLVNAMGTSKAFLSSTASQLTELIRQQYNRPSVCFWGLENEISSSSRNSYYTTKELLSALDDLVHAEDPSGRYSTQAVNTDRAMDGGSPELLNDLNETKGWKSDLIAWNIYPGWYENFKGTFEETIAGKSAKDSRPMGLSEYGCGASTEQHELYPELGKNGLGANSSAWHPEEYQSLLHEQAVASINRHADLWATYAWVMFDFDVDSRNEGSRVAQNDKGLVSNDRKIKKDSFYLYKANWNRREAFVHITSSRYVGREDRQTYVKVYSNCDSVALYVNGALIGDMQSLGNGIFTLEEIELSLGENQIRAVGVMNGVSCEDACTWVWPVYADTALESAVLRVDNIARAVTLDRELTLSDLRSVLMGAHNAQYKVMLKNSEVTDETAVIDTGMTIAVTAQNGMNKSVYSFVPYSEPFSAASDQRAWASSSQTGYVPDYMLDGDSATCWQAADSQYPQTVVVDLGVVRFLNALTVSWNSKGGRYYTYTVEISEDGVHFATAADRGENTLPGVTVDDLNRAAGRYVKVTVHSCSDKAGYAGIYEIALDAWPLLSQTYAVDHENKTILVPEPDAPTAEAFLASFTLSGDFSCTLQTASERVGKGDTLVLLDGSGKNLVYTVVTGETAHDAP